MVEGVGDQRACEAALLAHLRLELVEAAAVQQARQHRAHVVGLPRVGGHHPWGGVGGREG